MSSKTIFLMAFILGAASGATATWCCVKKKYEELAQEEIDSVKEVFARREQTNNTEKAAKNIAESVKAEHANQKQSIKECAAILRREGYTRYSDADVSSEDTKMSKPYVITPEQFGDNDDYDRISLTYYADQVLADENDEIIEDVEETIGFESLTHFGEYEDDSVFVRNDDKKCDYEILMDQRLYSDVINEMPHQMEV